MYDRKKFIQPKMSQMCLFFVVRGGCDGMAAGSELPLGLASDSSDNDSASSDSSNASSEHDSSDDVSYEPPRLRLRDGVSPASPVKPLGSRSP